jgi:hypothetical protein
MLAKLSRVVLNSACTITAVAANATLVNWYNNTEILRFYDTLFSTVLEHINTTTISVYCSATTTGATTC